MSHTLFRVDIETVWKTLSHRNAADHATIIIYRSLVSNTTLYLRQRLIRAFCPVTNIECIRNGQYQYEALYRALSGLRTSVVYESLTDEDRDAVIELAKSIRGKYFGEICNE